MTQALPARRGIHWYWLCQLAGWGSVVLFNLSFVFMSRPGAAITAVCVGGGCAGIALSHQWRRVLLRRRAASRPLAWPALALGILVLASAQTAAMWALFLVFQPFGQPHGLAWLPNAMIFWVGTFLAWTIFYHAVQAVRRARQAEAAALRLALAAKEAELRALIYQDADAAARMIDQLADLMRYALQSGHAQTVPLAAELAAVRAYLAIEQIRFEERLRVATEIEAGLEGVTVPPMALQTLVENAVKYGVETSAAGSEIRIRAWRTAGAAHIEVANTGALAEPGGSTQVGLANARKRLALALGEQAALELRADAGWVRATLSLPEAVRCAY
ncbi:sensor histidine kinase [Massilia sp. YMA4]|uniref:sensor histidine kinase n=1 Tax=Massilia sp. YMA4 TaxID=1593482 RepID=UPI000DD175C0|nr:histidine kinase [Massilia sp. YMA4]AXA91803.1 sensor histidine kinase [Massilia sp. YMA4]